MIHPATKTVRRCPCPNERRYFEPLDVMELVNKSYTFKTD